VRADAVRLPPLVRRFADAPARARFEVDFFEPARRALRRLARLAIWNSFSFPASARQYRPETLTVCR
jgi:hypothetical protein